jgi:hypothetical protein
VPAYDCPGVQTLVLPKKIFFNIKSLKRAGDVAQGYSICVAFMRSWYGCPAHTREQTGALASLCVAVSSFGKQVPIS